MLNLENLSSNSRITDSIVGIEDLYIRLPRRRLQELDVKDAVTTHPSCGKPDNNFHLKDQNPYTELHNKGLTEGK
jgi:hypothetical protein